MIPASPVLVPLLLLLVATVSVCGVQRYGMVIGLRPEKVARYVELHGETWPSVLAQIARSNIRNYSIHHAELEPGKHYLFACFEYTGDDFERDMQAMAADAETRRWWRETEPCQQPIATAQPGELWSRMEEVFYFAGENDEEGAA